MFREFERWIPFAVCDGNESSPILVVTDDNCVRLAYSSVNSMALTTLECYEQENIHVDYGRRSLLIPNESLIEEFNFIRKLNNAIFNSESIRERYNIDLE